MPATRIALISDERRNRFGVALMYGFMFFVYCAAFVGPASRAQHPDADVSNLIANP